MDISDNFIPFFSPFFDVWKRADLCPFEMIYRDRSAHCPCKILFYNLKINCKETGAQIVVYRSVYHRTCHPERNEVESRDLRTCSYICASIGAKILRLAALAQDDNTV